MTLSFAYDAIGRIDWQKHNGAMAVSYAWDASNNLTRLTYPDGWAVDYTYDALNRVTDAVDNNGTGARTLASVGYDALSRRDALTYANGASARYGYSARGDLTCLDWNLTGAAPGACNAGAPEIAYDFTYNGASQTLSETVSDPHPCNSLLLSRLEEAGSIRIASAAMISVRGPLGADAPKY